MWLASESGCDSELSFSSSSPITRFRRYLDIDLVEISDIIGSPCLDPEFENSCENSGISATSKVTLGPFKTSHDEAMKPERIAKLMEDYIGDIQKAKDLPVDQLKAVYFFW